jgi:hypothetical protein
MINPSTFLGMADLLACLLMMWSALKTTSNAGLEDSDARWAMHRRVVYAIMVISLAGLGGYRFSEKDQPVDWLDTVLHVFLLVGILYFPTLRALGYISQDRLLHWTTQSPRSRSPQRRASQN